MKKGRRCRRPNVLEPTKASQVRYELYAECHPRRRSFLPMSFRGDQRPVGMATVEDSCQAFVVKVGPGVRESKICLQHLALLAFAGFCRLSLIGRCNSS